MDRAMICTRCDWSGSVDVVITKEIFEVFDGEASVAVKCICPKCGHRAKAKPFESQRLKALRSLEENFALSTTATASMVQRSSILDLGD